MMPAFLPGPTAADAACGAQLLQGIDLFGADLTDGITPGSSVADCCAACGETEGCKAFTFDQGTETCYLKEGKGWERRQNKDLVSWLAPQPAAALPPSPSASPPPSPSAKPLQPSQSECRRMSCGLGRGRAHECCALLVTAREMAAPSHTRCSHSRGACTAAAVQGQPAQEY